MWNEQRQSAFNFLKCTLISALILAMSQDEGTFVLDVDASNFAVGAMLQQEQEGVLRVIGYSSRTINACEKKYCIMRKELAALVFGLKQYRQYLLGRHFMVRSDHVVLTYLSPAKELIGQQARWLDFIEDIHFDLQHRAGTAHGNADALSWKSRIRWSDAPSVVVVGSTAQGRHGTHVRRVKPLFRVMMLHLRRPPSPETSTR